MEDKKYQVFISSTYKDLKDERREVLDILLMADCIPAGMELFTPEDEEQFEVIKKVIDLCDYYILIIGKRYGSINERLGISYTEMEYDYAISQGIPVLVFSIDDDVELSHEKLESEDYKIEALAKFKNKAMGNRLAGIWKDTQDLVSKLAISIMKIKIESPRQGYTRTKNIDVESLQDRIIKLQSEVSKLKNENSDLQTEIKSMSKIRKFDLSKSYSISYRYSTYRNSNRTQHSGQKSLTLKDFFMILAKSMNDVMLSKTAVSKIMTNLIDKSHSIILDDDSILNVVLIELKELGLLKNNFNNDVKRQYWGLTKLGITTRNTELFENSSAE